MPRIDLEVPFEEKEDAKRLGARWDAAKKLWYAPEGIDSAQFKKWELLPLKPNGQPNDIPTVRSKGFYIAENCNCRDCWKCKEPTSVFAFFLPSGHERLNTDGGEQHGQWERIDSDLSLSWVTFLCENAVRAINELAPEYKVDLHHGYHWFNHCEVCGALLSDWYDHEEPGGAFLPETESAASMIRCDYYGEDFEGAANGFSYDTPFINLARAK